MFRLTVLECIRTVRMPYILQFRYVFFFFLNNSPRGVETFSSSSPAHVNTPQSTDRTRTRTTIVHAICEAIIAYTVHTYVLYDDVQRGENTVADTKCVYCTRVYSRGVCSVRFTVVCSTRVIGAD